MKRFSLSPETASRWKSSFCIALAAVGLLGALQPARAQSPIIAIGPPSFQTLAGPSLEDEILYRLTFLGPREPGDLLQLARLAELRSIATLASIQNDLRGTVTAVQLERETFALWNATDAFDQGVQYLPADIQNLAWSNLVLNDVQAAFGRLNSSLGGLPTLSPRGAFYLEGISQILPFAQPTPQLIEADIVPPAGSPPARVVSPDELQEQARLLARDLAELIHQIKEWQGGPRERDTVLTELNRLHELVAGFDRMLALEPTLPEVMDSFRLLIRAARPVEALFTRIAMAGTWRPVRDRLSALSDVLQLPRSIVSGAPPRPVLRRATDLLPGLDRAIALVAAVVEEPANRDASNPLLAKLEDQARRLEIKLLLFRQHVLAADSTEQLGPRLREIEALNQQLAARAGPAPPLFQGGRRNKPFGFQDAERTINGLRALLSD